MPAVGDLLRRRAFINLLLLLGAIVFLLLPRTWALLFPRTVPRSSKLGRTSSLRPLSTMTTKGDEFGDDHDADFLADFDVDAAVRAHRQQQQDRAAAAAASAMHPTPSNNTKNDGANKRLKVTPPSPATAKTNDALPFGKNSPFSFGYTTNPIRELASDIPYNAPPAAAPVAQETMAAVAATDETALEQTLQTFFGYSKFRPGQLQVLQAVLNNRDAAVFWATGSGKSLCYQIPALHTGKVSIVVSPLISLMQDQVNKLNGLRQEPLATFLGSAQMNASEEADALAGKYRLVYVTPEKLLSGGFLNQLAAMHAATRNLALIAIDESHCVSEWGHDFRVDYRQLHRIRNHPSSLSQVPIVALTATAVPRVQRDIVQAIHLRKPLIAIQSFDRPNLKIAVHKKKGIHAAFDPILDRLTHESTIVYAPTRGEVEQIAAHLAGKLSPQGKVVEPYHAGLSHEERTRAHLNFLVGRTQVVVATVAFGMGIDKPDTRRVVHYGPPKTVEEYYQQIGRAGRDGLPAECIMFVSDGDFDKYKSDFYVGGLQGDAKKNMLKNIDTLKSYALDVEKCRRKALLDFFNEESSFGERCGTCDTCQRVAKYGKDSGRDFGAMGARIVLRAIDALSDQGISIIEKVIGGSIVEPYRYSHGCDPRQVQEHIQAGRRNIQTRLPSSHFRELFAPLVSKGYVTQGSKTTVVNGFSRSFTTYSLTPSGRSALHDTSIPIVLPVTETLREIERKQEERRQRVLKQLNDAGVKIDKLPKEEIETGDGEVIRAFSKWNGYLESMRKNNRDERLAQVEDLLARMESWRSDAASKYQMAPAAVLAEHTTVSIAYSITTMKPGLKAEPNALFAAGVRTRELDSLVDTLNQWVEEVQPGSADDAVSNELDAMMVFLPGEVFAPENPWRFAVYKPMKKTGKASWESSHERFLNGEHPQTIAMSPANGRPIQMTTVLGHILDGFTQGRPVPLDRLSQFIAAPTQSEWEQLKEAEAATGMSVVDDPNTSGLGGSKFTMTEFLRPVMGDALVDTPYNERSEEEKATFSFWCDKLKWYMALRRTGHEPTFSE